MCHFHVTEPVGKSKGHLRAIDHQSGDQLGVKPSRALLYLEGSVVIFNRIYDNSIVLIIVSNNYIPFFYSENLC